MDPHLLDREAFVTPFLLIFYFVFFLSFFFFPLSFFLYFFNVKTKNFTFKLEELGECCELPPLCVFCVYSL